MRIELPEPCLVVLMGASGSGKSTFAATHFQPTEVISSDFCRALVSDDANDQSATEDAFAVLHEIAGRRLQARAADRGRRHQRPAGVARAAGGARARARPVRGRRSSSTCPSASARRATRRAPDRDFGEHVIRRQSRALHRSLRYLEREGFRYRWVIKPADEVEITRAPLWTDRRAERGPFDIIGDVHGCYDELVALLDALGYVDGVHPEGRRLVFVGDYVDRGPETPEVLRLRDGACENAICVPGNHDNKLARKLVGARRAGHARARGVARAARGRARSTGLREFLDGLTSHAVLDDGPARRRPRRDARALPGPRARGACATFALYGETTGETDEFGLPVRGAWADDYRGRATVVYGHTPVAEPEWVNNTINIDTGCVFGGALTALRWPERELVSVPAARTYYEPARPFLDAADARPAQLLDLDDVAGKRIIQTRLARTVTIREDLAAGALEVMSRFADRPALARLPAADDGADRDVEAPGRARAPGRGVRRVPRGGRRRRSSARRSTWARGRSRSSAATRTSGASASASRASARSTRARAARSWTTPSRALERIRAAVDARRACGRRSRPTGSCSTASCCRGRRRRWS